MGPENDTKRKIIKCVMDGAAGGVTFVIATSAVRDLNTSIVWMRAAARGDPDEARVALDDRHNVPVISGALTELVVVVLRGWVDIRTSGARPTPPAF